MLNIVFKIADDNGLLLLDFKDLRAMLQYVGDNAKDFTTTYGNISAASVGAIQRGLLQIESQGGTKFFGEPMLDINDFMQTVDGQGVINILTADKLMNSPRLYATFLLWMLSELFEQLPEIGDPDKPKLVFFFDEAHLLFNEAPKALVERIELVVRLVRSKGVGVYFVTQNPLDIPDIGAGPAGQPGAARAARLHPARPEGGESHRPTPCARNPVWTSKPPSPSLAVGEALVSLLDAKGRPGITERVYVLPPGSQIGPITPAQRQQLLQGSLVAGVYEKLVDRESAFEKLAARTASAPAAPTPGGKAAAPAEAESGGVLGGLSDVLFGSTGPRGGRHEGLATSMAKSAVRTMGSTVGREIIRGVLGGIFGSKKR